MRIPSGDLAPVRKRRRRYPGYGRRRHSTWPAVLVALVVVGAVVGAGYLLQQREDDPTDTVATQLPACPSPKPAAATPTTVPRTSAPVRLPAPAAVQLRLLNGTGRDGLARTVGNELARRGFRVAAMGNAPKPLAGPSRVVFGPGARPAATLLTAHVLGAQLVPAPKAPPGSVDVTLGSSFVRLRTAPEVSAFARGLGKPVVAKPAPATSPTCR